MSAFPAPEGVPDHLPPDCASFTAARAAGHVELPVFEGTAKSRLVALSAPLRAAGVRFDLSYGGRGLKGAMRGADRSGARFALVLGERDVEAGVAQLRELASGDQRPVPLADVVTSVVEALGR
ncbi:hypothetical protein GCM10009634_20590 [Saccharothrix xinjiangensis]